MRIFGSLLGALETEATSGRALDDDAKKFKGRADGHEAVLRTAAGPHGSKLLKQGCGFRRWRLIVGCLTNLVRLIRSGALDRHHHAHDNW